MVASLGSLGAVPARPRDVSTRTCREAPFWRHFVAPFGFQLLKREGARLDRPCVFVVKWRFDYTLSADRVRSGGMESLAQVRLVAGAIGREYQHLGGAHLETGQISFERNSCGELASYSKS